MENDGQKIADEIVRDLDERVTEITGAMLILVETARDAVRTLETAVASESQTVLDAACRIERLSADLGRQHERMIADLKAGVAAVRADLATDVSRQVQSLRATFLVATVLMLAIVFGFEWAMSRTRGGDPGPAATEPVVGRRTDAGE